MKPFPLEALNHHLVLKLAEAEARTKGGIILPDQAKVYYPIGIIKAVADNCEAISGFQIGQQVYFNYDPSTTLMVPIDGDEYYVVHEDDIVARKISMVPDGLQAEGDPFS